MRDESWDFYFCEIEGGAASVALDLLWGEAARAEERGRRPFLSLVQLPYATTREDRLPDADAGASLAHVEDVAIEGLVGKDVLLVGRITTAGRRDYFFYSPHQEGLDADLAAAFVAGGQLPARTLVRRDPEWELYFQVLDPAPQERQWMLDRRGVERLLDAGDRAEVPRPVSHRLCFGTEAGRERARVEAEARGFAAQAGAGDDPVLAFALVLSREEPIELGHLHPVALSLAALAADCDGRYEGWEAPVVLG
jgi:hypothetical protein